MGRMCPRANRHGTCSSPRCAWAGDAAETLVERPTSSGNHPKIVVGRQGRVGRVSVRTRRLGPSRSTLFSS